MDAIPRAKTYMKVSCSKECSKTSLTGLEFCQELKSYFSTSTDRKTKAPVPWNDRYILLQKDLEDGEHFLILCPENSKMKQSSSDLSFEIIIMRKETVRPVEKTINTFLHCLNETKKRTPCSTVIIGNINELLFYPSIEGEDVDENHHFKINVRYLSISECLLDKWFLGFLVVGIVGFIVAFNVPQESILKSIISWFAGFSLGFSMNRVIALLRNRLKIDYSIDETIRHEEAQMSNRKLFDDVKKRETILER